MGLGVSLQPELLVAAGILAVIILASILSLLLSRKPDPKAVMLLSLLEDLPREEEARVEAGDSNNPPDLSDSSPATGPRSYDFLA